MKISRLLAILLPIAVAVSPLAAREVDILQFGTDGSFRQESGKQVSDISSGARAGPQAVSASLRQHFGGGSPWPAKVDPPASRVAAAAHVDPQVAAMAFTLPATGPSEGSCDGTSYAPTWWLPRDVEARRAAQYPIMASIACEHGLPTNLLDAVITQESGYNAWAISRAGAMGMMQIMPGTARVLGLAQPFDAVANMRAGARYLRQQIDRFGGIDLALAAYNAGPERRSLKAGYIPAIPETRNYVRTITTNWARLASRSPELVTAHDRGTAAMQAAYASGYRRVELISYQGSNAANPI